MSSWTNAIDIARGDTVSVSQWNAIFGLNQSMQYIKDRTDFVVTDYDYKYTGTVSTLVAGWPQGDDTDFAATGDVLYPNWMINGITTNKQYITLPGPAKYLCIAQANINVNQEDYRNNDSILRMLISDTGGFTNFSTTNLNKGVGAQTTDTIVPLKFSVPFAIDAPFSTDVVIGFAAIQNYESIYSASAQYGPVEFQISPSVMVYKLPIYINSTSISTSFILGTSNLSGTSSV
jgi:hypothetical protein